MRKLVIRTTLLLLLAGLNAGQAAAQSSLSADASQANAGAEKSATDRSTAQRKGAAWYSRVFSAVAGGALGAGAGFFASQVFTGDWDEVPGHKRVDRQTWAAIGGSIGLAVGFSFPFPSRGRSTTPAVRLPGGRYAIMADELRATGINTAFEAVQNLRPEWLITRGSHIIGEQPDDQIEVYLDDLLLGGTARLKDVTTQNIHSMHFLDAAAATYRFGAGHSHGVILIVAADGRSGGPGVKPACCEDL
jgi:hypothetical protein